MPLTAGYQKFAFVSKSPAIAFIRKVWYVSGIGAAMPYVRRSRKQEDEESTEGQAGEAAPLRPVRTSPLIEAPIYLLVFFTPLAIGTAHLWSVAIMLAVALFAYSATVLKRARRLRSVLLFPMGVALLAVCGLTLLQLIPLPPFLIRVLNPGAADLFDHVLAGTGLWGEGNWRALSLAPPATAVELVKFLAYALAFLVVVNYFNDRHRARRLMKAVAWCGFTVALVGFFSKLFVAKAIFGVHPVAQGTFFFSTFVNPNHLAGFLGLCSPVALGLALSARDRQDRALYGFMGVIAGVGVFMSLSRGGIVAFCAGCVFLFIFAATRRSRKLRRVALVQAMAAVVLVLAGYLAYDTVIKELKTLGDVKAVAEEVKIRSWAGTLPMMADHPVVGIGRGAYATVYPRYKTVEANRTFHHPENGVLQNMVEWGPLVGILFVGLFLLAFLLALARARQSYSMGGCLAGIFIVSLHNLVDFSLEVGGVAMSFVIVMGILAASPFTHAGVPRPAETRPRLGRLTAVVLPAVADLAGVVCVFFAASHRLGDGTETLLAEEKPEASEPCAETTLGEAACEMLRHYPADYMAPLVLGKAFLETQPVRLDRAVHWLSRAQYLHPTSSVIHRLSGRALFSQGHREQALVEYRLSAEYDRSTLTATTLEVFRLAGDPDAVIQATPRDGKALLKVARIFRNLGKDEAAANAARMSLELDSALLPAMDLLAEMALAHGRFEEADGFARKAIGVDPLHERAHLLRGRGYLMQQNQEKAEEVWRLGLEQVPDSARLAYRLVELYLSQNRLKQAENVANRLKNFAPTDDRSQARLLLLLGRIQEAKGQNFEARRSYRMAADLAPDTLPYLYRVGMMEQRMGNWGEDERVYRQLLKAKYRTREVEERLAVIRKARELEKDQARWKTWVEDKSDQFDENDEEEE
jgi:tetratricopeptide (TPR) repeat protein/O-antigen ligase